MLERLGDLDTAARWQPTSEPGRAVATVHVSPDKTVILCVELDESTDTIATAKGGAAKVLVVRAGARRQSEHGLGQQVASEEGKRRQREREG